MLDCRRCPPRALTSLPTFCFLSTFTPAPRLCTDFLTHAHAFSWLPMISSPKMLLLPHHSLPTFYIMCQTCAAKLYFSSLGAKYNHHHKRKSCTNLLTWPSNFCCSLWLCLWSDINTNYLIIVINLIVVKKKKKLYNIDRRTEFIFIFLMVLTRNWAANNGLVS